MTRRVPGTREVAEELGVRPDLLVGFVDAHDRPTPANLVEWSGRKDVDEEIVAVWLGDYIANDPGRFLDNDTDEKPLSRLVDRLIGDGGRYRLPDRGARVRDVEDVDAELLVVDTHPDTTAADHTVEALGATVAELNPEYDPDAPVVDAVYVAEVDETLDTWRGVEDVRDAVGFGAVSTYSFPVDRLAGVP